jgi:hypothetical protein
MFIHALGLFPAWLLEPTANNQISILSQLHIYMQVPILGVVASMTTFRIELLADWPVRPIR